MRFGISSVLPSHTGRRSAYGTAFGGRTETAYQSYATGNHCLAGGTAQWPLMPGSAESNRRFGEPENRRGLQQPQETPMQSFQNEWPTNSVS